MKEIVKHFIGTWNLSSWQYYINNKEVVFWENPTGLLIYTAEMKMSAILMKSNRYKFKSNFQSKGTTEEKMEAIDGYISYAGDYSIDHDKVYHHVKFSLFPNWVNSDLDRFYEFSNDYQQLTLKTEPTMAPNGKMIKNILVWDKLKID